MIYNCELCWTVSKCTPHRRRQKKQFRVKPYGYDAVRALQTALTKGGTKLCQE